MRQLHLHHDGIQIRNLLFRMFVENEFAEISEVKVLEAGCGRKWALRDARVNFNITGIDLDKQAYEIRRKQFNDIDAFYHMSLEDLDHKETYDFVYCVDVLEHCYNVEKILKNVVHSLKDNGTAIIAFPNKNSIFGRVTYHTPHLFHVLFYRWIFGKKSAGKNGFGPYPVVYESILKPKNFEMFLSENNLEIIYKITRKFDYRRLSFLKYIYLLVESAVSVISPKPAHAGLIYVLRKRL